MVDAEPHASGPSAPPAPLPPPTRPPRLRIAALYLGGLLGPFGGGVLSSMLEEVRASFEVSRAAVASALSAYLIPFALLLLVSGTIGERVGRRRTVTAAYGVYVAATLVCAAAPNLAVFVAGRAVQGSANAFVTPLLVAGLAEYATERSVGRTLGVFASFQAAGITLAPLVGGFSAELNWRLAFAGVAVFASALALAPPAGEPGARAGGGAWRPLLTARMAVFAAATLGISAGALGLAFMVALRAHDEFSLGPSRVGLVLLGPGLAGLVLGRVWGALADRFGPRRTAVCAALGAAAAVALAGRAGSPVLLALCWAAAGAGSSLFNVSSQNLTIEAWPANRGGAISAVSAFRFGGAALSPLVFAPLYERSPTLGFAAAALAALGGALVWAEARIAPNAAAVSR